MQEAASESVEEPEEDFSASQLMHNNHKFMLDKSNILLMGPTGSGVCVVCMSLCTNLITFYNMVL